MAITVDWGSKIINVPLADLTFESGTLYSLDTNVFRLRLDDLMDDEEGIPFDTTHNHNTQITIAGVTYARFIEIINDYTVTFEDGMYAVRLDGSNNNLFDEGIINRNSVSIIPTNSAGLQIVSVGSGLSADQADQLAEIHGQTRRAIYVDTNSSTSIDGFQQTPYDNLTEAFMLGNLDNIKQIHIKGNNITVPSGSNISGFEFFGISIIGATVSLGSGSPINIQSGVRTQFHNVDISGEVQSDIILESCLMRDMQAARFTATNCLLAGTYTMIPQPGSPLVMELSQFIGCRDASIDSPTFLFGGGTHSLNIRDYVGNITLSDMEPGDDVDIGVQTGQVTIDALCTGGTVTVKGIGTLINNGTGVVVDDENFIYDAGNNSFGGMG